METRGKDGEREGGVRLNVYLIRHHTKSLIKRRRRRVCLIQQACIQTKCRSLYVLGEMFI